MTNNNENDLLRAIKDWLETDDEVRNLAKHIIIDNGNVEEIEQAYSRYSPLVVIGFRREEAGEYPANTPRVYEARIYFTITAMVHTYGNVNINRGEVFELKEKIINRLLGKGFRDYGVGTITYEGSQYIDIILKPYGVGVEINFVGIGGVREY